MAAPETLPDAAATVGHPVDDNRALGIALRVAAMAVLAGLTALVKWCAGHGVPVMEIVFFRNFFAFIPVGLYIWRTSGPSVIHTARPMAHLTRSSIGLFGMVCGFTAASLLPITQATALSFSSPLFMTAMSALLLKEKVGRHRWAAVALGFIGVLIMVRPTGHEPLSIGVAFALAGAVASAGAVTTIREIGKTERGPTIVFYFTLAGAVLGLASLPLGWIVPAFAWVIPNPAVLIALIAAGLVGGVGQLLHTGALRLAPVAVVAPFDYTQLVWASLLGWLIWSDLPGPFTLIGAVIVAVSGAYIVLRETRRPAGPA